MSTRTKPTPEQVREAGVLLQVEAANIAWSLVEPDTESIGSPRRWRVLTPDESLDVFDRLMAAVTRHNRVAR